MTVGELKKLLEKLPADALVEYFIRETSNKYSYERSSPEDFIFNEFDNCLVIKADWN